MLILAPSDTLHSVAIKLSTGKDIVAIMDFAGSAALQAVSKCPLHRYAGIVFVAV